MRRKLRDACDGAALGVDVNPSKDLGSVVRDPRALFHIIVLDSRSGAAWIQVDLGQAVPAAWKQMDKVSPTVRKKFSALG